VWRIDTIVVAKSNRGTHDDGVNPSKVNPARSTRRMNRNMPERKYSVTRALASELRTV
jgi:hypothetical protein